MWKTCANFTLPPMGPILSPHPPSIFKTVLEKLFYTFGHWYGNKSFLAELLSGSYRLDSRSRNLLASCKTVRSSSERMHTGGSANAAVRKTRHICSRVWRCSQFLELRSSMLVCRSEAADASPAPELLSEVPAGAPTLIYADWAAVRASTFYQQRPDRGPITLPDRDYADFVQSTGFDFEKDLDRVVIASWPPGLSPDQNKQDQKKTVVVADGRFDRKKIRDYALRKGKLDHQDGREVFLYFPSTSKLATTGRAWSSRTGGLELHRFPERPAHSNRGRPQDCSPVGIPAGWRRRLCARTSRACGRSGCFCDQPRAADPRQFWSRRSPVRATAEPGPSGAVGDVGRTAGGKQSARFARRGMPARTPTRVRYSRRSKCCVCSGARAWKIRRRGSQWPRPPTGFLKLC